MDNSIKITRPFIAYPTVLLFGLSILSTIISFLLGRGYLLPYGIGSLLSSPLWLNVPISLLCLIISSAASYTMFTVAHDAIHNAISKNKMINNVFGFFSTMWLGPTATWEPLRYNHLAHHRHTNDELLDPDYWCSMNGPCGKKLTIIRWFTVDISYIITFFGSIHKHAWYITLFTFSHYIIMYYIIIKLISWGYLWHMLQYWIIPSRIALGFLAFAFDFLPHYPHDIQRKNDKYRTTAYIASHWTLRPFLSTCLFYQNYHAAHHLDPRVPFYQYCKIWDKLSTTLLNEKDIRVYEFMPIIGRDEILQS